MTRHGYILMHRKWMDTFVFQDPYYWKLWSHCYMNAAYQDTIAEVEGILVPLKPGELLWGRQRSMEELNRGMKKRDQKTDGGWDYYLKALERKGMVKRFPKPGYTIVEVVDYAEDQNGRNGFPVSSGIKIQPPPSAELPKMEADDNPYSMYQQAYGKPLTAVITQSINEWTNNFGGDGAVVAYAIQLAGENGATSPRYFEAILRTWKKQGVENLAEAQAFTQEFEAEKERKMDEELKRKAQEKQLAPTPKEQLPTVSMHNWLAKEKSE